MKEKIKLWLVTMLLKMDPITVEDIYKKIKIALSNCTEII
jgi:hypothetical protein